jgi:putative methyltransferase
MCAWGQAALNDIRLFPEERIRAELEWFGQHKVDYLDQADANYGIVKRDIALTDALVDVKKRYGYPKTFRTSFAKNSNDTIWTIANKLHEAQMLKSVTLAMQSMEPSVLVNIQRKNIKFDKFGDLIKRYEEAGIPTYTELIIGLAGESLNTFLDGMERCLEAGQHSGLFCYLNISLENTEQRDPKYIELHGLKTRSMLAMLTHGTPDPSAIRERQEIVVETAAMPHAAWRRAYLHSKVVEVFHAQGLLQDFAIALHKRLGVHYRSFYSYLLDWCLAHPETVAGREIAAIAELLDGVLAGGTWDCLDTRLGDISWPPEEFAFARICLELDRFYDEIALQVSDWGGTDCSVLLAQQRKLIVGPQSGDEARWAREVVWYGRKGLAAKLRRAS